MEHNENEKIVNELLEFAKRTRGSGTLSNIFTPNKTSSGIDKSRLHKALQNPADNIEILQSMSASMTNTQGILKEFLIYKSNILTYDHYILPYDMSKMDNKEKLEKSEYQCALELDRYNLKFNLSWLMENLIKNGALYIYKTHTKQSLVIQEIPMAYCKIIGSINNVMKYAINLKKITDKNVMQFPEDIRVLWDKYVKGALKNDPNMLDGSYYLLKENSACFNLDYMSIVGVPYYAHIFPELMNLDEVKQAETEAAKLNLFKLIVQKVPLDENGDLTIEEQVATLFHQAMRNEVPDSVGVVTTPLPVTSISLSDNVTAQSDKNESIRNDVYNSAGINEELFNGKKSSNEAIALGSVLDTLLPLKLLKQFELWINEDFKNNPKTKNWKLTFVDATKYNQDSKVKFAKEMITTYYSKKQYFAYCGLTPLEVLNTLKYEEVSEISERMLPLVTSHTLSGESSENVGRPSNADSTDTILTTGSGEN